MKKKGVGFASGWQGANLHFGHPDVSSVLIELRDDLKFYVGVAAADLGQGVPETTKLIVSKALGDIPLDQIVMIDPDTGATPDGGATGASRQTSMTGNAAHAAAKKMVVLLKKIASELLDCAPSEIEIQSNIFKCGNGKNIPINDVINEAKKIGIPLSIIGTFNGPPTEELDEKGQGYGVNQFGYATYVAEVEVDTNTGEVDVLRISAFIDAGKIIRRLGAEMQVEGGAAMALGHTLTEEFKQRNGWPETDSYSTYLIPSAYDVPLEIYSHFVEEEIPFGELSAKGLAELVLVPIAPAVINAIYDAIGVYVTTLPATPERVLMAIQNKQHTSDKNG